MENVVSLVFYFFGANFFFRKIGTSFSIAATVSNKEKRSRETKMSKILQFFGGKYDAPK